jgi:hypothetical protein
MALEEPRRVALFEEFVSALRANEAETARMRTEAAAAAAAAQAAVLQQAAAAAAVAAVANARPGSPSGGPESVTLTAGELGLTDEAFDALNAEDLAQLRLLRWEQEKLRRQYEEMESKLREMEGRLSRSAASSPGSASPAMRAELSPAMVGSRSGSPARMEQQKDGVLFVFDDEGNEMELMAQLGDAGEGGGAA